ncbi:glycogen synthase GlgA [soil metagenome]
MVEKKKVPAERKADSPRRNTPQAAEPPTALPVEKRVKKTRATPATQPAKAAKPRPPAAPRKGITAAARPAPRARPKTTARSPVKRKKLSILMVASEAHSFAHSGGLAEVIGSLPLALARLGHTVTIVVPRYRGVETGAAAGDPLTLHFGVRSQDVTLYKRPLAPGVLAVLVDAPALYDRGGLYGDGAQEYGDNAWRFAVLSRAALEYARRSGERPSVIHAHDWQAGLVPVFQKMLFSSDPVIGGVPVVFTIHNLAFQGVFPADTAGVLGLPPDVLDVDAMEFWGQISYMKAGVNFSERITTVSPTYAREILQPEFAFGFEGVLARRQADLVGILNGIDVERWNPAADALVPAAFSADDLSGKAQAKRSLLEAAGLPAEEADLARPVIGMISRLTDQKGLDLVAAAVDPLLALDATWVLLGSGEAHYEALLRDMAGRHPERVSATIGFDERLAHLIEAGADIFLMPSRYEPCGLNQLYSLRYGTVPVVRATGGLADTVRDAVEHGEAGTGFTFRDIHPSAMLTALERALDTFRNPSRWKQIQQAGMRDDHSWDASAREYVKVYGQA